MYTHILPYIITHIYSHTSLHTCTPTQDDVSNPGHSFAAGVTLERISAHTVDAQGKPTFVTHNPLELLRKVCTYVCVYVCVCVSCLRGLACRVYVCRDVVFCWCVYVLCASMHPL